MDTLKKHSSAKKRTGTVNKQQSNSNQLIERELILDTPFIAVKMDEKWFLVTGKYRLPQLYNSYQECADAVKKPTWDMITCVMQTIAENTLNTNLKN